MCVPCPRASVTKIVDGSRAQAVNGDCLIIIVPNISCRLLVLNGVAATWMKNSDGKERKIPSDDKGHPQRMPGTALVSVKNPTNGCENMDHQNVSIRIEYFEMQWCGRHHRLSRAEQLTNMCVPNTTRNRPCLLLCCDIITCMNVYTFTYRIYQYVYYEQII